MDFEKSASNPKKTLETFANGRIGELITEVIGNDELQSRFEADPTFQAEDYEGKPSGIIALDLGIVNKDMKNALLVAQAAARTVATVEGKMEQKGFDNDVFKFVGSEGDPALLVEAQATWKATNVLDAPFSDVHIDAFKQAAASQLQQAAEVFKANGFEAEASKISAVAAHVRPGPEELTVSRIVSKELHDHQEQMAGRFGDGIYDEDIQAGPEGQYESMLRQLSAQVKSTDGYAPSGSAAIPWGGAGASKYWGNDGGPQ